MSAFSDRIAAIEAAADGVRGDVASLLARVACLEAKAAATGPAPPGAAPPDATPRSSPFAAAVVSPEVTP